jgi:hypothetical protein
MAIGPVEPLEQLGKLGPVAPSAADLLRVDFRAAARSCASCEAKLWPPVETRAYP